jgi:glycosyltransferase involved in cell wall biosynthesis
MTAHNLTSSKDLSVVICTHQPKADLLARTLNGLDAQSLPQENWETLLIDNASRPAIAPEAILGRAPKNLRAMSEPTLGLTHARKTGLRSAVGRIVVFVDDDNVLAPDYLEHTLAAFERLPKVGAIGGKSHPAFETEPPAWINEFLPLLALRDLGEQELISSGQQKEDQSPREYPPFAPIGAGMALRREAIDTWLKSETQLSDRRGHDLSSSGDNDMIFSIMESGWKIAYVPNLKLTHLMPAGRLAPDYLARLNRSIQRSWVRVLAKHDACPWPAIPQWTLPLRILRARVRARAWRGPMQRIRAAGLIGRLEGQADLSV